MCFQIAVIDGAKPAVVGEQRVAVIALKMAARYIVEEVARELKPSFDDDFVEANMANNGYRIRSALAR